MNDAPPRAIPVISDEVAIQWFDERWQPGEHMSIWGRTGSGKTTFIVELALTLWVRSRVLIVDTKKDRGTMHPVGHVVKTFPTTTDKLPFRVREWTRDPNHKSWDHDPEWYKLQPGEYKWVTNKTAYQKQIGPIQQQIGTALQKCFDEGDWVIVIDEVRDLSDPEVPGLDLTPLLTRIWREGRDRGVTIIAGTQAPSLVPPAMYDQPTYHVFGRMADARRILRLGEISGDRDMLVETLPALRRHEVLVVDVVDDMAFVTEVQL